MRGTVSRRCAVLGALAVLAVLGAAGEAMSAPPPLLPAPVVDALAQEVSGARAKRDIETITTFHRMRGSEQHLQAAAFVVEQLQRAGYTDARVERIPADGRRMYGSQRSRPAWNARFAELWEVQEAGGELRRVRRLASWEETPIALAEDSHSADVTAELVDVGPGTSAADYEGLDVTGKIVLTSSQPGAVQQLAVEERGAVGVLSSAQNQRTAWWGKDGSLLRWGHLDTFARTPTFGFMLSPDEAQALRERLAGGERILLHATVEAGQEAGAYAIAMATIPGADPAVADEEIVFSCHLDHQRPGANDNASGAVAILEAARTLRRLVDQGRIPPPRRTIRIVFPPEVEGTMALLHAFPELQQRIVAVIHMDMVGGGPATKAVFHVTRGPLSLPSFVHDVAAAWARYLNDQTYRHAAGERVAHPLTALGGGDEPLRAEITPFTMGSDHHVYQEGSFGIPAVYFNDWPDRYIHTNRDEPANIDATKLGRAAFLGAATALTLAQASPSDAQTLLEATRTEALHRAALVRRRQQQVDAQTAATLASVFLETEAEVVRSIGRFVGVDMERDAAQLAAQLGPFVRVAGAATSGAAATPAAQVVYRRSPDAPKGPMFAFGYSYLRDRLGAEATAELALLSHRGLWGSGGEYAYEALNLVDGRRSVEAIVRVLTAEYGPVPLEQVAAYLAALAQIGVLEQVR